MFYKSCPEGKRHFVSVEDFTRESLRDYLYFCKAIEHSWYHTDERYRDHLSVGLKKTKLYQLFQTHSLRTGDAMYAAADRLGATVREVVGEAYSSFVQTRGSIIKVVLDAVEYGYNAFSVRLDNADISVKEIADACDEENCGIHVFCAGEKGHNQPIQVLCDVYTAFQVFPSAFPQEGATDMTYALVGDTWQSPTLRDFAKLITFFQPKEIIFVSKPKHSPSEKLCRLLHTRSPNTKLSNASDLLSIAQCAQFVYFTQYYESPHTNTKDLHLDDKYKREYAKEFGVTHDFLHVFQGKAYHPRPEGIEFEQVMNLHRYPQFLHYKPGARNGFVTKMGLLLLAINPDYPKFPQVTY